MTPTRQLSSGLLLTAAAGFADVVGFIKLGGYFTSFMSGNTTQLGLAFAHADWTAAVLPASILAAFFVGSVLGSLLATLGGERWGAGATTAFVVACFGATLLLFVAGWPAHLFLLLLTAGAGAQNAILPAIGSVRLGVTFVTGTLFAAGHDLARAMLSLAPPWRWVQHLLVWFSLLLGGLAGGLAYLQFEMAALLIPLLIYLGFLVAFILWPPRRVVN